MAKEIKGYEYDRNKLAVEYADGSKEAFYDVSSEQFAGLAGASETLTNSKGETVVSHVKASDYLDKTIRPAAVVK